MRLRVQVDEELRLFLHRRPRGHPLDVGYDGSSSVLHVVESLGVPRTEIGSLAVGGAAVAASYVATDGALVEVRAAPRPQPLDGPPAFLLDVHLGALARRMRLLGLDTGYGNHADDAALVQRANDEDRVLLTQDRGLLRRRALRRGAYVRGAGPAEQLRDVLDRFAPPTVPWTRCPSCNGMLGWVAKSEVADRLEPGTRRTYDHFTRCGSCGRVFWRGAHSARLEAIVAEALEKPVGPDAPSR